MSTENVSKYTYKSSQSEPNTLISVTCNLL